MTCYNWGFDLCSDFVLFPRCCLYLYCTIDKEKTGSMMESERMQNADAKGSITAKCAFLKIKLESIRRYKPCSAKINKIPKFNT